MSIPLEHDYIGLTDCSSMEKNGSLNLKETELRLGLPGSESPERKPNHGVSLFGKGLEEKSSNGYSLSPLKNLVSGAKRGFSDAIDEASGKWVFSISNGSEVFSPKGGSSEQSCVSAAAAAAMKEVVPVPVPQASKPVQGNSSSPAAKAQVVGWPPIRSYRKNTMASNLAKNGDDAEEKKSGSACLYVKVSMDGAPFLRKVDLKTYSNYMELSSALERMFSCFTIGKCGSQGLPGRDGMSESRLMDLLHGSEYVLTYEDKDGDWMLVGDVPWAMFTDSCKRLRIMKGSEAIGLAPRAMEKCKNRS